MNPVNVRNLTAAILGLILLSPLNLAALRVLPHESAWPLALVFLMDVLGVWMSVRGFRSPGVAIALACTANVPLLWWVGVPEAGEWTGLLAVPKFALFLAVGWWAWWRRRDAIPRLRWLGAVVPTVCCAYIVLSPFISAGLWR